jgi:heat shock protein HslJ
MLRRMLCWVLVLSLAGCAGMDAPGTVRHEDVTGGRWHWVGVLFDAAATSVPDPSRYWLEFASQGGVVVNADCNGGLGRLVGPGLSPGPISLTRRMCDPGSMDARFARLLSQVRSGTFDGGLLRLHTDASDLLFTRDARSRMQRFVCPGAAPREVVFETEAAYLRVDGRFRQLRREASDTGALYRDGEVMLVNKGGELTVEARGAGRIGPCIAEA